jgi:hypothetical protein
MFADPNTPNLADFLLFCENFVGINPLILPSNSPFYGFALNQALGLVIRGRGGIDYTLAVYNGGAHILIRIAPDQPGRSKEVGSLHNMRVKYNLDKPVAAGVVAASSDQGTSMTLAVSDSLKQLTLTDLNFMKTPYGQEMLARNQDFGGVIGVR